MANSIRNYQNIFQYYNSFYNQLSLMYYYRDNKRRAMYYDGFEAAPVGDHIDNSRVILGHS